jgi:GNAT superfamily N-acetyltransferase
MSVFYKHYKNKPYKFLGTVRHSETLEEMALYETRYENDKGKLWVRPKDMFFEKVTIDGVKQDRFRQVPLEILTYANVGEAELNIINELSKKVFTAWDEAGLRGALSEHVRKFLLIAKVDGAVAGFKLGYARDLTKFYSGWGAVDPEYRGLGVAQTLMTAQHNWCRGQGFKTVETRTKNIYREMISLNLRNGFDIVGSYTDEKGEPKLILEKKL